MKPVRNGKIKWTHKDNQVVYYPIVEATEALTFVVTERDLNKAKNMKGYADPNCCVAACAVRRQFTDAVFQRDTAYTLQVHKGKVVAKRYRFSGSLRRAVAKFDSEGIFTTGAYTLKPPTASQTLEAKRLRASKKPRTRRRVRKHNKFMVRGKITPKS